MNLWVHSLAVLLHAGFSNEALSIFQLVPTQRDKNLIHNLQIVMKLDVLHVT